jgi:hypothetical protein
MYSIRRVNMSRLRRFMKWKVHVNLQSRTTRESLMQIVYWAFLKDVTVNSTFLIRNTCP